MPERAPSRQAPTVFISYAHESDALRASVAALAEWLGRHGCRVFTASLSIARRPGLGRLDARRHRRGRHRARRLHAQAQGIPWARFSKVLRSIEPGQAPGRPGGRRAA